MLRSGMNLFIFGLLLRKWWNLVDALGSGSSGRTPVGVRVPPFAQLRVCLWQTLFFTAPLFSFVSYK